jgi:hypothetical protein
MSAARTMVRFLEMSGEKSKNGASFSKPNKGGITQLKGRETSSGTVSECDRALASKLYEWTDSAPVCYPIMV